MSLLDIISSKNCIERAWSVVKGRKVSAGIDGVTVDNFESSLSTHLSTIRKELRGKNYKFQPSRRVAIPKGSGNGTRNIHVFTIRDKIVQQAIQSVLLAKKKGESLFPEVYNDVAVAYIPKLNGVAKAVERVKSLYSSGHIFITCLDIQDFFDNIPGDQLLQKILSRLPDHTIDWLIEATIKQKVYALDDDVDSVLQGAVLAPLYSNIYLSEFDAFLISNGIGAIRYADDLAIFSKTEVTAASDKEKVRTALKSLTSMNFYPDDHVNKAPKTRCLNDFADFLGFRFAFGPKNLMVGPSPKKIGDEKKKLTEVFQSHVLATFLQKIQRCNNSFESWCQHYYRAGANQTPMRSAIYEIAQHYEALSLRFLKSINIVQRTQTLSREQLNNLGLLAPSSIKRKR